MAKILSILQDERPYRYFCEDDRGRKVTIQATTFNDFQVGRWYLTADIDNTYNPNNQRLVFDVAPKNVWRFPAEIPDSHMYSTILAVIMDKPFKEVIPGFRFDTVIDIKPDWLILEKYGWATTVCVPQSFKPRDRVVVIFRNHDFSLPHCVGWRDKPRPCGGDGRVVLLGIDAQVFGNMDAYVRLAQNVVDATATEATGILVIGKETVPTADPPWIPWVKNFWDKIGTAVGEKVTYIVDTGDIDTVVFGNYKMIGISQHAFMSAGEITNLPTPSHEALCARASDISTYVQNGGGLLGLASEASFRSDGFTSDYWNPAPIDIVVPPEFSSYGYLSALGDFTFDGGFRLFPPITEKDSTWNTVALTPEGVKLGLSGIGESVSTRAVATPSSYETVWEMKFLTFPSTFNSLVTSAESGVADFGIPCAIGSNKTLLKSLA